MKDAAKEYFTVKRMPSTNGAEKILSLDDMIKSSMVVEYIDANGKKCDRDKSYVKVTKVDDEYEMEVSLTCDKVTKKIVTTVGCYDFCESGSCEKDTSVTLYQYSKKIKGTSKWTDWSEWSTKKVTPNKTTKVETKTVKEASGTTTKTVDATANTTYSCKEGKLSDNKCLISESKYVNVTYYRYKTYVTTKDSISYKWSTSSKDSKLIKAGYKYTGVTKTTTSK
jgi:hypothetical protein